jgi:hypothetical protein
MNAIIAPLFLLFGMHLPAQLPAQPQPDPLTISIYPNPANSVFQFQTSATIARMEVFSVTGELVKDVSSPGRSVNIEELNRGLYLVRFTDINQASTTVRLTVE